MAAMNNFTRGLDGGDTIKKRTRKPLSLTLKEPLELSNRRMENAGVKNCQRPGEIKRGLPPLSAQGEYR